MLSLFLSCASVNKIKRNCYFRVCAIAFRNTFDEFVIFRSPKRNFRLERIFVRIFFSIEITDRTFLYFSFKSKRCLSRSKKKKFFDRFGRKESERIVPILRLIMNRYEMERFFSYKLRVYKKNIRCCFLIDF